MLTGEIPEFVVKEGEEVVLSCPVNTPGELREWDNRIMSWSVFSSVCGEYHSLKWYRNTQRVYVFSQMAHFSQPEDSLMDRSVYQFISLSVSVPSILLNLFV